MSSNRDQDPASRHRLFHAMVLMGGSLALRCGGEAATNGGGSGAGGATTGGTPTAAVGGSGGSVRPSGGNVSSSGGSVSSSGGSPSGGGPVITVGGQTTVDPGPFDCPPAQWNCAADPPLCYGSGFRLPEKCACDPNRPLDAAACGPGQSFVCLEATYTANAERLTQPVPFACACMQNQLNCGLACDAIFPNSGNCSQKDYADTGLREILCDCAVIVLR